MSAAKNAFFKTPEEKRSALLFLVFGAFFSFSFVRFLMMKNATAAALSLLYLLIAFLLPRAARALSLALPIATHALILLLCLGALLGSTYNFYFLIESWDIWLHVLAGWLFSCLGYAICILLFTEQEKRGVFPCLLFGVCFSLSIALLWELFEWLVTLSLPVDMQEDALVYQIKSFFLSGTHASAVRIDGITKTVIHYGGGQTLTLDGYLDLGLWDTLSDMAVCLLGSLAFLLLLPLNRLFGGKLLSQFLPRRITRKNKERRP